MPKVAAKLPSAENWPTYSQMAEMVNIVLNFSSVAIARPEQKDEGVVVVADELCELKLRKNRSKNNPDDPDSTQSFWIF